VIAIGVEQRLIGVRQITGARLHGNEHQESARAVEELPDTMPGNIKVQSRVQDTRSVRATPGLSMSSKCAVMWQTRAFSLPRALVASGQINMRKVAKLMAGRRSPQSSSISK
jgi:hypothetical protein